MNIITSVPGVMPNHALPPEMNTATTLMITTAMPAVITPRTSEERIRFESRSTTSRLAASNSERS